MRTPATLVLALIGGAAILTGCSSGPEPGPVFDDEQRADIRCMRHQETPPGARYTESGLRRTEETMALLRYYTAHGDKPYCDGLPATEADRAWATVYVELGADPANVDNVVG